MSTQAEVDYENEELSEQSVHNYLAAHPDFFEKHADLLGSLNLSHASGEAVSLVERQVSMLREKDLTLQKQLKELIEVARANDLLSAKIHELTIQLFASPDLKTTIITLEEGIRSEFGADQAVLVAFSDSNSFDDISLKAELNNFAIVEKCYQKDDIAIIPLDILIITQPMDKLKNTDVSMPLYAMLLDQKNQVLETQYFMVLGSIKRNFENNIFIETDITDKLKIITENLDTAQIVIGFMIDDKKRLLLN